MPDARSSRPSKPAASEDDDEEEESKARSSQHRPQRRSAASKKRYSENSSSEEEAESDDDDSGEDEDDELAVDEESEDEDVKRALQASKKTAVKDNKRRLQRAAASAKQHNRSILEYENGVGQAESSDDDAVQLVASSSSSSSSSSSNNKSSHNNSHRAKPARGKYMEVPSDEDDDSDAGDDASNDNASGEEMVEEGEDEEVEVSEIERILGRRVLLQDKRLHHDDHVDVSRIKHGASQYLVKFRERGYIHSQWLDERVLHELDPMDAKSKLDRWKRKEEKDNLQPVTLLVNPAHTKVSDIDDPSGSKHHHSNAASATTEAESNTSTSAPLERSHSDTQIKVNSVNWGCDETGAFFDSSYCIIERIVDSEDKIVSDHGDSVELESRYLVKWSGLQYDELTWEDRQLVEDNNAQALTRYVQLSNEIPTKSDMKQIQMNKNSMNRVILNNKALTGYNDTDNPVPAFANGYKLRDYQLEGLNWLILHWSINKGALLADEMGLVSSVRCGAS